MMIGEGFWLQSPLFKPEEGEDAHTNPGCYGKAISEWIEGTLKNRGIEVEGVIPEDWGWCVLIFRGPFMLWVGCGNVQEDPLPTELTWHCFVEAEVPFWKFWNKWLYGSQMRTDGERIHALLSKAFLDEPRIKLVEEKEKVSLVRSKI